MKILSSLFDIFIRPFKSYAEPEFLYQLFGSCIFGSVAILYDAGIMNTSTVYICANAGVIIFGIRLGVKQFKKTKLK